MVTAAKEIPLKENITAISEFIESDENFAYIAGYTEGGAPFGVTWAEWEKSDEL